MLTARLRDRLLLTVYRMNVSTCLTYSSCVSELYHYNSSRRRVTDAPRRPLYVYASHRLHILRESDLMLLSFLAVPQPRSALHSSCVFWSVAILLSDFSRSI